MGFEEKPIGIAVLDVMKSDAIKRDETTCGDLIKYVRTETSTYTCTRT